MIQRLIRFSIQQRHFVIAAALLIMVLGALSFRRLPIDVFPDPSPALVQIYTEGHGMAPEEVERLISYPIEAAMFGLPKVTNIRSASTFGLSTVNVYFEGDTDIYWARQLVLPRLTEVLEDLPAQAHEPVLGLIATGLGLVYLYYLEGDGYTTMELRISPESLIVATSETPTGGRFERTLSCRANGWIALGFNPKYLSDALKTLEAEAVVLEITDTRTGAVMHEGKITMVIMPIRLAKEELAVIENPISDIIEDSRKESAA